MVWVAAVALLLAGCASDDEGAAEPDPAEDFVEVETTPQDDAPGDAQDGADAGGDGADDGADGGADGGADDGAGEDEAVEEPAEPEVPDPGETYARWNRVMPSEPGTASLWLNGVAAGPSAVVAVGEDDETFAGAAIVSTDGGATFRRAEVENGEDGRLWAVAATDTGFVAVGEDAVRDAATVWTSEDGQVFARVAHDEEVFGGPDRQRMFAVTPGGPGFVAVGEDMGRESAAVWTSTDGRDWQRIAADDEVFASSGLVRMVAVTAGGPGLVAVGDDFEHGGVVVWTSPDGLDWSRVAYDAAVFGAGADIDAQGVSAGEAGVVAVGRDYATGNAAVWTSPDGLVWSRVEHDAAVFGGGEGHAMAAVVAVPGGFVAGGSDFGAAAAAVWTSPDGVNWQRVADDPAFAGDADAELYALAVTDTGVIGVGHLDFATTGIWVSP